MINIEQKKIEFAGKRATIKTEINNKIAIMQIEHRTAMLKLENELREKLIALQADEDKVLRQYQQERHEENLRRYSEIEKLRKESLEQ
jgi:RNase adaptor protein for sRNA GlmZ degradation